MHRPTLRGDRFAVILQFNRTARFFSFINYVLTSLHRIISYSVRNLFLTGIRESQFLVKLMTVGRGVYRDWLFVFHTKDMLDQLSPNALSLIVLINKQQSDVVMLISSGNYSHQLVILIRSISMLYIVRIPRRHIPMILSRLEHPSSLVPHTVDRKPCAASRTEQEHPVLLQVLFSY